MQFALDTWTNAKVTHINKRVENHGQEVVHAKDINWLIAVPNTLLDQWFPGLLDALYEEAPSDTLPGIERAKTALRTDLLKPPYSLKKEYAGYTLTVERQNGHANIELPCDVNAFKLTPKVGGTCELAFRTQSSGLEGKTLGQIDEIDGHEVRLMMLPPALQDEPQAALLPPADAGAPPEAGDIFAAAVTAGPATTATKKAISFKARAQSALRKKNQGQAARP